MSWTVHSGRTLLEHYSDAWQALQYNYHDSHPLFDMKFIGPALRHFGADEARIRLAVRSESGEAVALALLENRGLGRWQLFLPSQIPLGPLLLKDEANAGQHAALLQELLSVLPGYAWTIGLLKQDGAYSGLFNSYDELTVERLPYATTVSIAVSGSFDGYWRSRSKRLQAKMRRLLRRLEKGGGRLLEFRDRRSMADAVAEHGRLESAGWKGQTGTAIHRDNVQGRFYREVLERYAVAGGARVYQLEFGGRVIASQIAIHQNGMMVLLKTAHDESFAAHSPGRLLDYLMLQRLFTERDLRVVEFYTSPSKTRAGLLDNGISITSIISARTCSRTRRWRCARFAASCRTGACCRRYTITLSPPERNEMTSSLDDVKNVLTSSLQLGDRARAFTAATRLLGSLPELDSMAVIGVIEALERHFGFTVHDDEISAETFGTVGSLCAFVEQKLKA